MRIFAGNLGFDVTNDDLKAAFAAYGQVASAEVVKDRYTDRSRGFGFVEMPTKAEAEAAIKGLNGTDLKGRPVTVNESRPRTEQRPSGGGGRYR